MLAKCVALRSWRVRGPRSRFGSRQICSVLALFCLGRKPQPAPSHAHPSPRSCVRGPSSAFPTARSSILHCDYDSVATSLDSSACQPGSFSIACATTDTAAAIAAHAAQGACSRMNGKSLSTFPRRSIPAAAYSPVQAEVSAAPMATQEEASFTNVHPEAQSWHPLRVKNDHSGDRQPEEQRHQHWRNKPLSEIKSTDIGHVTPLLVEAGAQPLSVTDSCRGRAVMAKAVTARSPNSEANRIRRTAKRRIWLRSGGIIQTKRGNSADAGNVRKKAMANRAKRAHVELMCKTRAACGRLVRRILA